MDDPRQAHGNHTWNISIDYASCPFCGLIMENRKKYERRLDRYEKDLACDRCGKEQETST